MVDEIRVMKIPSEAVTIDHRFSIHSLFRICPATAPCIKSAPKQTDAKTLAVNQRREVETNIVEIIKIVKNQRPIIIKVDFNFHGFLGNRELPENFQKISDIE